jgi:hypothetical protein
MEPFEGRRREFSRLPQYLIKAMLGCAMAVAEWMDMKNESLQNKLIMRNTF